MDRVAIVLVALAAASPATAQQPQRVYTNVVDGRPGREIVQVLREVRPAAPVPASITTTPTPVGWTLEIGGSGYVPPSPTRAASSPRWTQRPVQPRFVNGIYVGPARSWTTTVIGRPIVDVRIVNERAARGRTR